MKPDIILGTFSTTLGAPALWLIFCAVMLFFTLYSALILYHWLKYGFDGIIRLVAFAYGVGAVVLAGAMYLSMLSLT